MRETMQALMDAMGDIVYGQEAAIRQTVVGLLAGGHILVEGVPGLGKTRLARALAHLIDADYRRIQFTPDLMPSDILGNAVFNLQENKFETHHGPVFTNVLLADEINRTPPKTQSALLEVMEERQASIYGHSHPLPEPFFVIATQNPVEYEGTYPLPEAQLDRFLMKTTLSYPAEESEVQMLQRHNGRLEDWIGRLSPVVSHAALKAAMRETTQVTAAREVLAYIVALVRQSRTTTGVALGASPRAATALLDVARAVAYLEGRDYIIPDDVLEMVAPVLRHRLVLDPSLELEGVDPDSLITRIVEAVEVPR